MVSTQKEIEKNSLKNNVFENLLTVFLKNIKDDKIGSENESNGSILIKVKPERQEAVFNQAILHFPELFPVKKVPLGLEIKKYVVGKIVFLSAAEIEEGGPQPRFTISPADPETQALFDSIRPEGHESGNRNNIFGENQHEPIHVYPSPNNNGKYRICEGHRRHFVIFNMLQLDCIYAIIRNRTELEAYEDALVLNNKKNLSPSEVASFIYKLTDKFPEIYQSRKHGFAFQETIAKRLCLSRTYLTNIITAYKEIETQKPKLSPEFVAQATKLPEKVVRSIHKAEESLKPSLVESVITQKLSSRKTEKLVDAINANPEATPEFVKEKAQEIAIGKVDVEAEKAAEKLEEDLEEYAEKLFAESEKLEKKFRRDTEKLINGVVLPHDFLEAIVNRINYELIGTDKKLKQDQLNAFVPFFVETMYSVLNEERKFEGVFKMALQAFNK